MCRDEAGDGDEGEGRDQIHTGQRDARWSCASVEKDGLWLWSWSWSLVADPRGSGLALALAADGCWMGWMGRGVSRVIRDVGGMLGRGGGVEEWTMGSRRWDILGRSGQAGQWQAARAVKVGTVTCSPVWHWRGMGEIEAREARGGEGAARRGEGRICVAVVWDATGRTGRRER